MRASIAAGIVAAMVIAVLVNVLASRRPTRWDVTRERLYTLSEPTRETLLSLPDTVRVEVLLPAGDPLLAALRQLLEAYVAETPRLEVRYTDPDRNPGEFLAVTRRHGVLAGRTEDGRVLTDAAVIVVRGERPYYLSAADFVAVDAGDPGKRRSRLEHALTGAIRGVLGEERTRVCFTAGRGEMGVEAAAGLGLAPLFDRLRKNNYLPEILRLATPEGRELLRSCRVVVVGGPEEPLPRDEVDRLAAHLDAGGNLLLALGPAADKDDEAFVDLGFGPLLERVGVELRKDLVVELDPARRLARGFGEAFLATPRSHEVTAGLVRMQGEFEVVLTITSSLTPSGGGAAPAPLLVTSDRAIGMDHFLRWARREQLVVNAEDGDRKGPLVVAMASELAPPARGDASRGGRVVVIGTTSVLAGGNWIEPELRGTALFTESALSWLAARPVLLDLPERPARAIATLTEGTLRRVLYACVALPLVAASLGLGVVLRRRAGTGAGASAAGREDGR